MEKNKMDSGGKENTRLEQTHNLVHISNVVLSDHIKWGKNEGGKYTEQWRQPDSTPLPTPLLQKIDIRDFDEYIRYITKINTLSDVNIRNLDEISLQHFERILRNPPVIEEMEKRVQAEQHIEHASQEGATQLGILGHTGGSSSITYWGDNSGNHANGLFASPKAKSHWQCNHSTLLADDAWCDLSSLTRRQEELSETLDYIDRDINALIRKDFQNYLHIIAILNELKGEIKNLHDEIKTLRTHIHDVKEMLLKIIHLKKYNDLKKKCKQVNHLLNRFLHFRRLIKILKRFLQKRKFYHCLVVVNKIFKIYFFFKKKRKLLYFHQYFCNFNISYLKSFFSQNFLFLFFFHSLLFLFRPRGVAKASLCSAHWVKKRDRLHLGSTHTRGTAHTGETSHTRRDDTAITQGDTLLGDNPGQLSIHYPPDQLKQNPHCLNSSSKGKSKFNRFVTFHKRLNRQFMRNFHRKRKRFVKCRKAEEAKFFVKRWQQGVCSHFYKKIRKRRGNFDHHLAHLNNLFTPALFFNNFFHSLRNLCSRENYLKHFVDDLFYGLLHETVSDLRRDQFYDLGDKSLLSAEEVAAQSGEEESPSRKEPNPDLDPHSKPNKREKTEKEKTNQALTAECTNHVEAYPSGRITLSCEHLVIEKCRKKKILHFDQDGWRKLYRQVGLLPLANLVHLLGTFFGKIKMVQRRMNKWASFLMAKIVSFLLDDTWAESFARYTPHLTRQTTKMEKTPQAWQTPQPPMHSFPFSRSNKSSHSIKHVFSKFWKNYRDIHHTLFKLLLERISEVLNVRRKCNMHLGINQMISLYWTVYPMFSFVRRKGRRLEQEYTRFFVRGIPRFVRSAQVSRTMYLCGKPHEGRRPLRVRITLTRNKFIIAKKMKTLNCNVGRSRGAVIKLGEVPLFCLPPREEAKCCEDQAPIRTDVMNKSEVQPRRSGQFDAHNGDAYMLDSKEECHPRGSLPRFSLPRFSLPSCYLPPSANLRIGSQNFHVPHRVSITIHRRAKQEQVYLSRFLQRIMKKTPRGKEAKQRLPHDERNLCRQIRRRIRIESIVAINHFYEFKKIQMEKSLEIEKWNVLEDIPQEINAQMEKYFKIKNEHKNKLRINGDLFYLTNSSVSFLCILFQYIHFMLSIPDVSFEIISKILTFYDKQFLKMVHHFIMDGHAVTNCTLKSITIKILAVVIHTLDFADSTVRRVYAISRHLLYTPWTEAPPLGMGGEVSDQKIGGMSGEISDQKSDQVNGGIFPNSVASRNEDRPNGQINVSQFADKPNDCYPGKDPHRRATKLPNETANLWGNARLRHPPGETNEEKNGSTLPPVEKCIKGERTTIRKKTYCGRTNESSSLRKNEKHTHEDILQGMDTSWVGSVLVDFTKCLKYPTTRKPNRIPRGIRLSKKDQEKIKSNFNHMLQKSFLLKKKLAEKIVDILSTRFDYYTNIWLVSDSLLENHLVNSFSYECDILPYGMQLRSTFKLLTTYLREEDTRNIYRELFQDIANRFSLRINVLKGNDKYKKIISRLMDESAPAKSTPRKSAAEESLPGKSTSAKSAAEESLPGKSASAKSAAEKFAPGKSQIDQLIMHYHSYELKEKTAHNIHKNVGDKILIDMTNVLIILYKDPLLSDIIETFLNDFLKICTSHWYVTIDPFVILSKYKK
ncbi:hypothetical protein C922_04721 [Plasmodium inui San Antonio 1]|uniref:Vacuolar protein sorting-associated protein 54 C-terminal domain-containing protein n=1 Tax=Plasmodium inui San Antonio 1 TaxID=1237626 RepID=W6ZVS4_9APIC|nr:hypothetical protein C922_04721 [Plasmodium inui San Antonio 1]EUD64877.1 hypothetical protein C922_04721 [Plasmodium inui San Antonio 1]